MNDRDLLELAAKAAGYEFDLSMLGGGPELAIDGMRILGLRLAGGAIWSPLTDDGDALRLAVTLRITVGPESPDVMGQSLCRVSWNERTMSLGEYGRGDPMQAARRAIVRAAAHIGGGMP